jgi:hypothetical protein
MDPILAAAQAMLNSEGDGWQVTAYVLVLGCERVIDGRVESQAFRYAAGDQPRWVTNGLLDDAEQLRDVVEDAE